MRGAIFLHEAERGARDDDAHDDGSIQPIAARDRNERRDDQDEHQWAEDLDEQDQRRGDRVLLTQANRFVLSLVCLGVFGAKTGGLRHERKKEHAGGQRPKGGGRRLPAAAVVIMLRI